MTICANKHTFTESVRKNEYTVINCLDCGYWHVYPIPKQNELEQYYREKYYKTLDGNRTMTDKLNDPDGFYGIQYEDRLRRIEQVFSKDLPKTVIDLGAGYGDFMSFMKKNGWEASGIEPSSEAYENIQDKTLDIKTGSIEQMFGDFSPASLVTINNVLEHVRDPQGILDLVRECLLVPGGITSIIVPNDFNILQEIIMKNILNDKPEKQYYWVAPPDHLSYWSTKTIRKFLERCGFRVLSMVTDFPIELFPLMGEDYINHPEIGRNVHLQRINLEKHFKQANEEGLKDLLFGAFATMGVGRVMQIIAIPDGK